jgi:hypothetical protein
VQDSGSFQHRGAPTSTEFRFFDLPHEPVRDEVIAANEAEKEKHLIARTRFMDLFLEASSARAAMLEWRELTGLAKPFAAFAAATKHLATAAGYTQPGSLLTALEPGGYITMHRDDWQDTKVQAEVSRRWNEANQAARKAQLAFVAYRKRERESRALHTAAQHFVCARNVPWPWLAEEMITRFESETAHLPWQIDLSRTYVLHEPQPKTVEPVRVALDIPPGTDAVEASRQLAEASRTAEASLRAQIPPKGRRPGHKERATLIRDADWFYSVTVERETVIGVARAHFVDDIYPEGRRKDIRDGMDRVQHLLELSPWRFQEGPDGSYLDAPPIRLDRGTRTGRNPSRNNRGTGGARPKSQRPQGN